MPKNLRYVAFLRGINVGGNKLIKMDALAARFHLRRIPQRQNLHCEW